MEEENNQEARKMSLQEKRHDWEEGKGGKQEITGGEMEKTNRKRKLRKGKHVKREKKGQQSKKK